MVADCARCSLLDGDPVPRVVFVLTFLPMLDQIRVAHADDATSNNGIHLGDLLTFVEDDLVDGTIAVEASWSQP